MRNPWLPVPTETDASWQSSQPHSLRTLPSLHCVQAQVVTLLQTTWTPRQTSRPAELCHQFWLWRVGRPARGCWWYPPRLSVPTWVNKESGSRCHHNHMVYHSTIMAKSGTQWWRRDRGLDCGSGNPGLIPGIPSPLVSPLMARR